jgi:hypothetical protein
MALQKNTISQRFPEFYVSICILKVTIGVLLKLFETTEQQKRNIFMRSVLPKKIWYNKLPIFLI